MNIVRKCSKCILNSLVVMLLIFLIVAPVSATVYGTPTFTHGITDNWLVKNTFGKTTSTATENSMQFLGLVQYFSGPYAGETHMTESSLKANTNNHQLTINPGRVSASSYFIYFIDDICEHQSTSWWNFDFR